MKYHVLAAAILLGGSSMALAQQAEQEQQEQQQAAAVPSAQVEEEAPDEDDPGEEVVCRTERITGSLTRRRRTCMTRNEWANLERNTAGGVREMGRNASGGHECVQDQFGGC